LKTVFEERVAVAPMAAAMVSLEQTFDNLKRLEAAQWQPLPQHPDVEPGHEALLLREHFTELLRTDATAVQPPAFQALLRAGLHWSQQLESGLDLNDNLQPIEFEQLTRSMQQLAENCRQCHAQFRDAPQQK